MMTAAIGREYCDYMGEDADQTASLTVADISDRKLVERAVLNCRSRSFWKGQKHPRWVAVMDTFGLGSTYAHQLCQRFGINPDEQVKR